MYLICNIGYDDVTYTEMDLSPYEYRVIEKFAIENNKNSEHRCQPEIEIYSEYKKGKWGYKIERKNNLIPERE